MNKLPELICELSSSAGHKSKIQKNTFLNTNNK